MLETEDQGQNPHAKIIRAVVAVGFLWAFVVVCWGLVKWERTGSPDFEMTGQFGDSFGFIGAMMAATAAYFAYRTYRAQSEETRILRDERREAAKLRAEPSFLNLLERRYDALKQFLYEPGAQAIYGQEGIDRLADGIEYAFRNYQTPALDGYLDRLKYAKNHPHLFRFIYHIVRYAERHFDGESDDSREITRKNLSYRYVSLLRSQLSDGELFLLALNVLTPEGSGAKRLYERFALFHNLSAERMKIVRTAGQWDERAFGLPPDPVN